MPLPATPLSASSLLRCARLLFPVLALASLSGCYWIWREAFRDPDLWIGSFTSEPSMLEVTATGATPLLLRWEAGSDDRGDGFELAIYLIPANTPSNANGARTRENQLASLSCGRHNCASPQVICDYDVAAEAPARRVLACRGDEARAGFHRREFPVGDYDVLAHFSTYAGISNMSSDERRVPLQLR